MITNTSISTEESAVWDEDHRSSSSSVLTIFSHGSVRNRMFSVKTKHVITVEVSFLLIPHHSSWQLKSLHLSITEAWLPWQPHQHHTHSRCVWMSLIITWTQSIPSMCVSGSWDQKSLKEWVLYQYINRLQAFGHLWIIKRVCTFIFLKLSCV